MASRHVVFDRIAIGELMYCHLGIDMKHFAWLVKVTYFVLRRAFKRSVKIFGRD